MVELISGQVLVGLLVSMAIVFWAYTSYKITVSENSAKVLWILAVLFFPIIGSIIYWLNHNSNRRRRVFQPFNK